MELVSVAQPQEAEVLVLVGGEDSEYTSESVIRSFYATARLQHNSALTFSERDGIGCAQFKANNCQYELCVGGGNATLTITSLNGAPVKVPAYPPSALVEAR